MDIHSKEGRKGKEGGRKGRKEGRKGGREGGHTYGDHVTQNSLNDKH